MTLKQKQARERFKKVQAEAKKLRMKNPSLSQAQAVKQAWAIAKGNKIVGESKMVSGRTAKNYGSRTGTFYLNNSGSRWIVLDKGVKPKMKVLKDAYAPFTEPYIIVTPEFFESFGNFASLHYRYKGKKYSSVNYEYADDKLGAVKILQKGESKNAKVTKTLTQIRNKKGQFKGYKKVSGTGIGSIKSSDFSRITNDTNGNPRYVIHYLNVARNYEDALKIARKVGGKKFHNKQYGGGIVFQSYDIDETAKYLNNAIDGSGKLGATKSDKSHKDTKSHNVNIRVVSGVPNFADPDMAREIQLWADNDSRLYFSRKVPILKNLEKKYKKGTYDIDKASKLWMYYINDALQRYNKEFGSRSDKWHSLMSVHDRKLLAKEYAIDTLNEFQMGNFIV